MICASVLQSTPQVKYTEHHRVILCLLICSVSELVIHAVPRKNSGAVCNVLCNGVLESVRMLVD